MKKTLYLWLLATLLASDVGGQEHLGEFNIARQDGHVVVRRVDGSQVDLKPTFIVIYTSEDPHKRRRLVDHGFVKKPHETVGLIYGVPVWGKPEDITIDPSLHVMDGFDPENDRQLGEGQTANMFLAGQTKRLVAPRLMMLVVGSSGNFRRMNLYRFVLMSALSQAIFCLHCITSLMH